MRAKLQILLAVVTAVTGSFLKAPSNHFQLAFNSTFLNGNERLFRPIVIPNTTRTHQPRTTVSVNETLGEKENELILKKILHPEESTLRGNYLGGEPKPTKFSSRYSTNQDESTEIIQTEKREKSKEGDSKTTQVPDSERNEDSREDDTSSTEIHKSFLNHSDDSEEKEDTSEPREGEESEISSTTNEPYSELQRSTSFRNSDEDHGNYETTSPAEERYGSEEEAEDKRSAGDYYNSGSKNYHSIQTPLDGIKYRGPHSYDDDFESEGPRTRLIGSIRRRPINHNWPYSRAQVKGLEKLNEISDSDESYEKALDEGIKEEVTKLPKNPDLESAVEKDELKYDRNKKYNYIEERNRRKQQQKGLIAEEEKDDSGPLFESLKHYKVDEEHQKYQPKVSPTPKLKESIWSTNPPHITTPKNIFRTPKKLGVSSDLTLNFQGHQFLGPVVFSQNEEQKRIKPLEKNTQRQKQEHRTALKGLLEKEKLDEGSLTNQRFQKSVFGSGGKVTQSFNHVEESNEMYNAILANIQSVFGLRTRPLKSGSGTHKAVTEASLVDSTSLTWSSPLESEKIEN